MSIHDRIISEHIIHFDMIRLRNQRNRKRAGEQIRSVMKYSVKMQKEGYIIEHIKPIERGYTGKGLFYGIRIRLDNI